MELLLIIDGNEIDRERFTIERDGRFDDPYICLQDALYGAGVYFGTDTDIDTEAETEIMEQIGEVFTHYNDLSGIAEYKGVKIEWFVIGKASMPQTVFKFGDIEYRFICPTPEAAEIVRKAIKGQVCEIQTAVVS